MRKGLIVCSAMASCLLAFPISASAAQSDQGPPRWAANIARKQHVIMNGLPRAYASARDPLPNTRAKLSHGATVFDRHCSSCHGWNGQGGGPDAFALVPAPADLEWLRNAPKGRSEPYVYWTVAEGGASSNPTCRRSNVPCRRRIFGP